MPWSAIITALVQVLLPILVEWLTNWLQSRLNQAASEIPSVEKFGDNKKAVSALFDRAISGTPFRAFARRSLLRWLKNRAVKHADDVVAGQFTLASDDHDEIRDLGMAAEND